MVRHAHEVTTGVDGRRGLLVITAVKLFVVDLSNTGTIAQIVSFTAVDILLLVVGYLAPAPPKAKSEDKTV